VPLDCEARRPASVRASASPARPHAREPPHPAAPPASSPALLAPEDASILPRSPRIFASAPRSTPPARASDARSSPLLLLLMFSPHRLCAAAGLHDYMSICDRFNNDGLLVRAIDCHHLCEVNQAAVAHLPQLQAEAATLSRKRRSARLPSSSQPLLNSKHFANKTTSYVAKCLQRQLQPAPAAVPSTLVRHDLPLATYCSVGVGLMLSARVRREPFCASPFDTWHLTHPKRYPRCNDTIEQHVRMRVNVRRHACRSKSNMNYWAEKAENSKRQLQCCWSIDEAALRLKAFLAVDGLSKCERGSGLNQVAATWTAGDVVGVYYMNASDFRPAAALRDYLMQIRTSQSSGREIQIVHLPTCVKKGARDVQQRLL